MTGLYTALIPPNSAAARDYIANLKAVAIMLDERMRPLCRLF